MNFLKLMIKELKNIIIEKVLELLIKTTHKMKE